MKWSVVWTERALRDADRIEPKMRRRILAALDRYAADEHGNVKRLEIVDPPEWRLRVGDWRIRFGRDAKARTLIVLRVLPRDKAYR